MLSDGNGTFGFIQAMMARKMKDSESKKKP
jgi:hypothetical protein